MASYCEGKVAVVTGAGGTLCSCIAIDLAKKGAKVVLIGRTAAKLEKTKAAIEAACDGRDARQTSYLDMEDRDALPFVERGMVRACRQNPLLISQARKNGLKK